MGLKDTLTRDKYTIAEHHLKTADGKHTLYIQEWGNKSGTPIMFLHGGPGSGCHDGHKNLFDPGKHYVIFHDQRGSGRSKPLATMEANTTHLLVQDIVHIKEALGLDRFAIFGRSWGSTLALCYGIEHPQDVTQIITGGVFLGTRPEIDWLEKGHFKVFYPEVSEKIDFSKLDDFQYAQAVTAIMRLDDRYSILHSDEFEQDNWVVERGYSQKDCFLPADHIINNAHVLTMPVHIVQGRYDMLTVPEHAYALHKALPNSTIQWTVAGHSSSDRANFDVSKALLSQL